MSLSLHISQSVISLLPITPTLVSEYVLDLPLYQSMCWTYPCIRVCVGRGHYQIRPWHSYSVNPAPVQGPSALDCCEHPAYAILYSEEADTCVKSSKKGIIPRFVPLCEVLFETHSIFSQ